MSAEFSLSDIEIDQLGKSRAGSSIGYINHDEWSILRPLLVEQSLRHNPLLNSEMTAFTPGETLNLLKKPEIVFWHQNVAGFIVPSEYERIILVPCAKTKPWDSESSARSVSYKSYNEIIRLSREGNIPPVYFVTLSEPLGIVPQDFWGNFLQYDNPGLFKNDFLRTGMYKRDWVEKIGARKQLPFDVEAYKKSIKILGKVIGGFLRNNYKGRKILAFVDSLDGSPTSHGDMLSAALGEIIGQEINIERFPRKEKPRVSPLKHILSKIC